LSVGSGQWAVGKMNTPEFLVWAVEFSCLVRGFQDGRDPERVERQLRVARAVSDAEGEGRVFEGVAVRGEEGFRIEEAMGVYGGGRGAVEGACGGCPANALAREGQRVLAGCYGMVVCPWESEGFHACVDGAVAKDRGAGNDGTRSVPTTYAWYGLWMGSPLDGERAGATARILEAVEVAEPGTVAGLGELALALSLVGERGLRVHVALYPEGLDEGGVFALARHCPRCKRTWGKIGPEAEGDVQREDGGQSPPYGKCAACGYEGICAPMKKRRARGRRPYFSLERLLGEEGARELLRRVSGEW
jgi:hypothetical protein